MNVPDTISRTQAWMTSNSSLSELNDRTNVMLASIEADGGTVSRMEVIVTPMSQNIVLYTAWIQYRERISSEENA